MRDVLPVAVLISGRGSNMAAIARAGLGGDIRARVVAVISDRRDAAGLDVARGLAIATSVLSPRDFADQRSYGAALAETVVSTGARLVALAGFMRILDACFIHAFEGHMLNIHPSLLPRFPGLRTHRRVLEAGDAEHGCTVHFVTEELDAGPRVVQARIGVRPEDDENSLSARVQHWEHRIYPEAVGWFSDGRLECRRGHAWLDGRRLDEPVQRGET